MLATVGAAVAIGSSIASGISGINANKAAKEAAKNQAKMTYMTRMEEIRRAKYEQALAIGSNRAKIGASNIQFSGSAKKILDQTRSLFSQDIAWRRVAAEKEREAILSGAPGSNVLGQSLQAGSSIINTLINYNK